MNTCIQTPGVEGAVAKGLRQTFGCLSSPHQQASLSQGPVHGIAAGHGCARMVFMDSEPLQIPLVQLRNAFDAVLRHVEASAGHTVALRDEYFWSVPGNELYDVLNEP
ncbi:hypothetical protein [Streptomyces sp. NPDC000405]|uniref:hypothetical protein n=1 Tax=Streptomyces sp. NPDC000405 TaxID=3161033 RepID=UPI00398D3992